MSISYDGSNIPGGGIVGMVERGMVGGRGGMPGGGMPGGGMPGGGMPGGGIIAGTGMGIIPGEVKILKLKGFYISTKE